MSMKGNFILSLVVTFALGTGFIFFDPEIRNHAAPAGIISLELCSYFSSCESILSSWGEHEKSVTSFLLGIDYLFLIAYSLAIYAALQITSTRLGGTIGVITKKISLCGPVAGLCDAVENSFLISAILSENFSWAWWPASIFATAKFSVIAIAILWFLFVIPLHKLFRLTMRSNRSLRSLGRAKARPLA